MLITNQLRNTYHNHCCFTDGALYFFLDTEAECGSVEVAPNGTISTPDFGEEPYPSNERCVWLISTDPGKRIALGVKDGAFSVEEGSSINTCDNDYVTVYDGNSNASRKIGPFCGNTSRPFQTIHSSGRHLYIEFRSNSNREYAGFQLEYTTYREGEKAKQHLFKRLQYLQFCSAIHCENRESQTT